MSKLKIFLTLLIVQCTLLIGSASAQWWVQGGNLLWPYGDVTIQKNLNLGMGLTINDSIYFNDDSTKIYNHRFYEEGEFTENNVTFDIRTSTNNNVFSFGNNGLAYSRDGLNYLSASSSGLTARNSNGQFHLVASSNNRGSIRFSRTSDSYFVDILMGAGSPEGSASARVGSIYLRTDGGAGTYFYVKESGTSTTGWVAK